MRDCRFGFRDEDTGGAHRDQDNSQVEAITCLAEELAYPHGNQRVDHRGTTKHDRHHINGIPTTGECRDNSQGPQGTKSPGRKSEEKSVLAPVPIFSFCPQDKDRDDHGDQEVSEADTE